MKAAAPISQSRRPFKARRATRKSASTTIASTAALTPTKIAVASGTFPNAA